MNSLNILYSYARVYVLMNSLNYHPFYTLTVAKGRVQIVKMEI